MGKTLSVKKTAVVMLSTAIAAAFALFLLHGNDTVQREMQGRSGVEVREQRTERPISAAVTRVVDGDTIVTAGNEKVRLIGVDTLEIRSGKRLEGQAGRLGISSDRAMKWGRRAREFAERELGGQTVELRPGFEHRDRYGRLLAYVWYRHQPGSVPVCFNRNLLDEGYAIAYRKYKHPALKEYVKAELTAKRLKKGLWADAGK